MRQYFFSPNIRYFSPIILLPKNTDFDNCQELNYILLHEYLHIRRFDCLIKIVAVVTVCIHWFNPLVWLMYFFLKSRYGTLLRRNLLLGKNGKNCKSQLRTFTNRYGRKDVAYLWLCLASFQSMCQKKELPLL